MGQQGTRWKLLTLMVVILPLAASLCFADGPGFDCGKAKTSVEKLICEDTELSKLDKEMTEKYASLLPQLKGEDKEKVKQNQKAWIKRRNEGCEPWYKNVGIDYCIMLHQQRVEELRDWKAYVDNKNTTLSPPWLTPCWKREEPIRGPRDAMSGDDAICRAFEQLLNTTCEAPQKLVYGWALPAGEKRFQRLAWQPLDWREHWRLIEDLTKMGVFDSNNRDARQEFWIENEPIIRKEFEKGCRRLSMASVSLPTGNPQLDLVVRMDKGPLSRSAYGIMIPGTKRFDWDLRRRYRFSHLNSSTASEIMLYEGRAYMFGWEEGGFQFFFIWDVIGQRVCKFDYLKGKNLKGDN